MVAQHFLLQKMATNLRTKSRIGDRTGAHDSVGFARSPCIIPMGATLVYSLVCPLVCVPCLYSSVRAATSSRQKSGMSGTTQPQTE